MQRKNAEKIFITTALFLATLAWKSRAADLLDIYRMAKSDDPHYEAAQYELEAALERIPQARGGLLPAVNLAGSNNSTTARTEFTSVPQINRNVKAWTWTLQLTQPLFRMQNVFAYRQSEYLVDQAHAQFSAAQQELILRVAQSYFDVLVAQETLGVADAQMKAMEEQWRLAQRGFKLGISAITDVHEAKAKAEMAHSQHITADSDLEIKRSELEKLIGTIPSVLSRLKPSIVLPKLQPSDMGPWVEQARYSNATVVSEQAALDVAEEEINKNRAEHLPTVDLVASVGNNYSSNNLTNPTDYASRVSSRQAGIQLNVPIFAGGATSAKVSEAVANRHKAHARLEEARRKAIADAKQAYLGVHSSLSQLEALLSTVASNEAAVEGNRKGYSLGIRINSDVLMAEQQLYSARRDLVKARYEALLQVFKLKIAAGILNEDDVIMVNSFLTPVPQF